MPLEQACLLRGPGKTPAGGLPSGVPPPGPGDARRLWRGDHTQRWPQASSISPPLPLPADSKLPRGVCGWEGAGRASDEFRKALRGRKQPVRFPKGSNTSFSSSSTRMREWASMGPRHVLARCPCPSPPTEGNKFQAGSQLCSHSYPRSPRGWHIAGPWSVADVITTWERSP